MNSDLERLINRVEQVLARFEATLPQPQPAPDWKKRPGLPMAKAG